MKRKFTLIEMIVVIVILAILAGIVLIGYLDFKKTSIRNVMVQNTKILQTSVDEYYLKNDSYPIKNNNRLSLTEPQLIEISTLTEEGYLNKELNTSKIKTQYYWVDVFGKVWGATEKKIHSINLFKENDIKNMEFVIGENIEGYNIYEVSGYHSLASENQFRHSNEFAAEKFKTEKSYKLVEETTVNGKGEKLLNFNLLKEDSDYLISVVDQYGLESAPFGKFSSMNDTSFVPLLNKTGVYEFEITSEEIMHWVNFLYLIKTPGESSVDFQFKIKGEDGEYGELQDDFFSLDPSKGIVVKIDMKGDDKGNKPSVYDIRVVFKYEDEVKNKKPELSIPEKPSPEEFICPNSPIKSDISRRTTKKETGNVVYDFYIEEGLFFSSDKAPALEFITGISYSINSVEYLISLDNSTYVEYKANMNSSEKCMLVVYNVTVEEVPSNAVIDELCKGNIACSSDYCDTYKNCPVPTTCEDLGNCAESCSAEGCGNKTCIELNNCPKPSKVCGSGGSTSSYYISTKGKIVYHYKLDKNESISKLEIDSSFKNYKISNIYLEYSVDGSPYTIATSINDIPAGSCVNVVYEVEAIETINEDCFNCNKEYVPPTIETCKDKGNCPQVCNEKCKPSSDKCLINCEQSPIKAWCDIYDCEEKVKECTSLSAGCVPTVCTEKCSEKPPTGPSAGDKQLNDPEWTTVEQLRFFGHGAESQLTRWYKVEHKDLVKVAEKTRIVYRYSKSNSYYWSSEYDDFTTTGIASSVLGTAYIQVKTKELKNVEETNYPEVVSMKFYNEKGYIDVSMVNPTLAIIPVKDNNVNRPVFSDKSNIEWKYDAADPRNKKIVDIQWDGDIRSKYPVGSYEVKARVKNDVEIWSEWVTYKFEVLQEKPIAVLKNNKTVKGKKASHQWSVSESYDPDGDKLAAFELKNAKEEYELGEHIVEARVKDSEGYWSDWVQYELKVGEEGVKIYRLEAEVFNDQVANVGTSTYHVTNPDFSNGAGLHLQYMENYGYVEFKFKGTGFDFFTTLGAKYKLDDSGYIEAQNGVHSVRNLENKEHSLKIYRPSAYIAESRLDYVDVYSPEDKVSHKEVKTRSKINSIESTGETNVFSTLLNQEIIYYYQVDNDSRERISVLSFDNKFITELSNKDIKGGTLKDKNISWNGKDSSGQVVQNGEYQLQFEYTGVDGAKSSYKKTVVLKNEPPIYRLEAEVFNDQVANVGTSTYHVTNPNFSNGAGLHLQYMESYGYVEFRFKGTGFDFFTTLGARYTLDGSGYIEAQSGVYSVRNLENKDHVLRIYRPSAYIAESRLDYVDVYSTDDKVSYKEIKTRSRINAIESTMEINIFSTLLNQEIVHYYQVNKNSRERISVLSSDNKFITELSNKDIKGGTLKDKNVSWNGKDSSGQVVPNGEYDLQFEYTGIDGTKSSFKKKVILKNEPPIYRLEAEVFNDQVANVGTSTYHVTNPAFSNGAGLHLQYMENYGYVEFKFKGTGFDLYTTLGARYSLDYAPMIVTQSGVYSVRNLENKDHVLRIYRPSAYIAESRLDYVDVYSTDDKVSYKEIKTRSKINAIESTIETNIFSTLLNQEIVHYYQVDKNSRERISVLSSDNKFITELSNKEVKGGTLKDKNISWNGKDSSGQVVPNGEYNLQFEYTGIDGTKSSFKKKVVLRNEPPSYRLEAEVFNNQVVRVGDSAHYEASPDLSNGAGLRLQYMESYGHVEFRFKGTGFDFFTTLGARYSIDYGPMIVAQKGLFSIRDLENKDHVIRLFRVDEYVWQSKVDYLDVYE